MFKTLFAIALLAVAPIALTTTSVSAQQAPMITICHRDTDPNSENYPYGQITINENAVDNSGHPVHSVDNNGDDLGVYDGVLEDWGDIIPPYTGNPDGYNWTAAGQAIWNNDCVVPEPSADISWNVTCIVRNDTDYVQVTLMNEGNADGDVTVNGETITVAADSTTTRVFADGTRVTIVLDQQTVYDQVSDCSEDTPQVLGTSTTTPTAPALPNTGASALSAVAVAVSAASVLVLAGTKIARRLV